MASRFSHRSSNPPDRSQRTSASIGTKRRSSDADDSEEQMPLQTSKLANLTENQNRDVVSKKQKTVDEDVMGTLFKRLQESDGGIKISAQHEAPDINSYREPYSGDKSSSSGSVSASPAHPTSPESRADSCMGASVKSEVELTGLQRRVLSQEQQIAAMQEELNLMRSIKATMQHTSDPSSEFLQRSSGPNSEALAKPQTFTNASTRPSTNIRLAELESGLPSESLDAASAGAYGRSVYPWTKPQTMTTIQPEKHIIQPTPFIDAPGYGAGHHSTPGDVPGFNPSLQPFAPTTMSGPVPRQGLGHLRIDTSRGLNTYGNIGQPTPLTAKDLAFLQSHPPSRPGSAFDPQFALYGGYPSNASPVMTQGLSPPTTPLPFPTMGQGMPPVGNAFPVQNTYVPRPIGTRPSPPGSEYTGNVAGPWNTNYASDATESSYIPPVEPLNYRRLLERNASCNWDYIVDKIICHNDQQASIFLQQKLKQATPEHKHQIIQAIIQKAYPLMINRFGNFLVQRCFEHGNQDQIIAIANAIRGNTLALSMDAFGCHVVQKAFDVVPEEYKAIMVHELLRNIPQTVIHRYACHVWQKLFELRWSDSPPQIMKYVNEALCGMWHSVALGETGSLVVQNIYENCLEEDKRPCIDECLANIDEISRGQFGNWCIQHICEHGAHKDRTWAIDHILRNAQEYSMDQYASKVVEKCLKIGGDDFMDRFLDRVCEARPDRPRQAIIDIAGDQYGNYLIQWVLANASLHHREIVSTHVRKHMVSLRGSKYGSRVAMLCCNPQSTTRPGAPAGFQLSRYNSNGSSTGPRVNGMTMMGTERPPYGGPFR